MKRWTFRLIFVAVLLALGGWLWLTFFPRPEKVIRKRLQEFARTASFASNEGSLAKMDNSQRLTAFCTDDVELMLDVQGYPEVRVSGRDAFFQGAMTIRTHLSSVSIEFLDIVIALAPSNESAVANLTAKVRVPGEKDMIPQELKMMLKKVDGKWLIRKVETVKTLGQNMKSRIRKAPMARA
jgi:hypothetical protein